MSTTFTYRRGAERPNLTLPWQEETAPGVWGNLDLSTGYTFELTLTDRTGAVVLEKDTGITGADGSVTVEWEDGDLDLPRGRYRLHLRATTGAALDRDYSPGSPIRIVIVDPIPEAA